MSDRGFQVHQSPEEVTMDVAVIGMSGRFPGADCPEELWERISQGENCISTLSDEDIGPHIPLPPNYVRAAPILNNISDFDAAFFGITPHEAELMDPQHRLFIECCWEALESAGYDPRRYPKDIGVFAGARTNTYLINNLVCHRELVESVGEFNLGLGNDAAFLTTRVSHMLNLRGPSCFVQTACSTSLVAIHLACQSILMDECQMAMAGGVAVNIPHKRGYLYEDGGVMSPDGCCRVFDAQARGTVFGSGVGVVLLKRLQDALEDGDSILAVIKGSAVNNDGAAKSSFTAPAIKGQISVIREAQRIANIEPGTISYIECHGTGTLLGDAVEMRALNKVFAASKKKPGFCAVGSIKSNIGHLDAAAGVTGFIKVVLSLKHGMLTPSLHFHEPNPQIDFAGSPFYVNTKLRPWRTEEGLRRAAVSAFGVGGTNAHVILEAAPKVKSTGPEAGWHLLPLSARSLLALRQMMQNLLSHLCARPQINIGDVAYTFQVGRHMFPVRRAVTCRTLEEAKVSLSAAAVDAAAGFAQGICPRTMFLFGADHGECAEIYGELRDTEPAFRGAVDECAAVAGEFLETDVRAMFREYRAKPKDYPAWLRPIALFALEFGLAKLWMDLAVTPQAVAGEGIGAFVAACIAGVFSLMDAMRIVSLRSRLTSDCVNGIEDHLVEEVRNLNPQTPNVPLLSSRTGAQIADKEVHDPLYWVRQFSEQCHWEHILKELDQPSWVFLQLGPALKRAPAFQAGRTNLRFIDVLPGTVVSAREGFLRAVGELWELGINIEWEKLHQGKERRRVPLPTYPFERQRYWVDATATTSAPIAVTSSPKPRKTNDVAQWFWVPSWTATPVRSASLHKPPPAKWVLLADRYGLGDDLAFRLRAAGHQVALVVQGNTFKVLDDESYVLNPEEPSGYNRLIEHLRQLGWHVGNVIHCWGFALERRKEHDELFFHDCQVNGLYSLIYLAQACLRESSQDPVRLWVFSSGTMQVESKDRIIPEKTGVLAIAKTLPQEEHRFSMRVLDLEATDYHRPTTDYIDGIFPGLLADSNGATVAYRGPYRWTQTWQRVSLSGLTPGVLRAGGVYVITGGLGVVPLMAATWIAETVNAKFVLVGRSALPPREAWEEHLAAFPNDLASQRIKSIQALERLGSAVEVMRADVSDREEMGTVLSAAREHFGRINGLIHAAGVTTGDSVFRLIQELGPAECEAQSRPKARGLRHIEELLQDDDTDFILCMSSNASVLGGLGFTAYAAANLFMDSLAQQKEAVGAQTRWLSVNWDHWPEETKKLKAFRTSMDEFAMTNEEARQAFLAVLSQPQSGQLVVSTSDLQQRISFWLRSQAQPGSGSGTALSTQHMVARAPRPRMKTVYVAPRNEIERTLTAIWEDMLGLEKVGINDDFFELGGHSLLATRLIVEMRRALRMELSLEKLFAGPSIAKLASGADHNEQPV